MMLHKILAVNLGIYKGFTHVYTVFHTQYHTVHYAAAWTADPSKARWYLHFNLVQMVRDSACEVF